MMLKQNLHTMLHQGLPIALTGMLIVFAGLLCLSLFIRLLPYCCQRRATPTKPPTSLPVEELTTEELEAVIGLVMELENARASGEQQRITTSEHPESLWSSAARMRRLSDGDPYA